MEELVSKAYLQRDFISGTAAELEEVGYKLIPNFFSERFAQRAVEAVHQEMAEHGNEYFSLRWQQYHRDSVLREIRTNLEFKLLLVDILRAAGANPNPTQDIHSVLRVCMGQQAVLGTHKFHFDAYNITALMPILFPDKRFSDRGDLIVYPNLRGFGRNVASNLIWKLGFQNRLTRAAFSGPAKNLLRREVVKISPRDLCLFFGYRSYHGNMPVDPKAVRATALFHFDDPHADSKVVSMIEAKRKPPQARAA